MPLLAIDTSAAISVAILDEVGAATGLPSAVLATAFHDDQRQHAELLAPMIADLLADAGLTPAELTAIAVGTGPGPFTGLRIGLVTAETLGFAQQIPVYGVCSLEGLAVGAAAALNLPAGTHVVAVLDARRKEVYWAQYQVLASEGESNLPKLETIVPPQVTAPARLPTATASCYIVGDGALKYGIAGAAEPRFAEAKWVGQLAEARAAAGMPQPTTPLYLRRPDIQGVPPQLLPAQ